MSLLKLPVNSSLSLHKPSENGPTQGKLTLSPLKATTEDILSTKKKTKKNVSKEKTSSMPESQVPNNQMNLKTRSLFFDQYIHPTRLSQISEAELTSRKRDFSQFWNQSYKVMSKKLWSPHMIDSPELAQNFSNGFLTNLTRNSLYFKKQKITETQMKNSQTTSWKSLPFSPPGIMVKENIITRKIRFYPNDVQRKILQSYFNIHRYFYNITVEYIKKHDPKIKHSFTKVRKNIKISNDDLEYSWMKDYYYDVRQNAVSVCVDCHNTNITKLKSKTIKKYELKYINKKKSSDIFYMAKKNLKIKNNAIEFFTKLKGKDKYLKFDNKMERWIKKNINKIETEPKIQKTKCGKYYLLLGIKVKNDKYNPTQKIAALDPGKRSFQVMYSSDEIMKVGEGFDKVLLKLHKKIDSLKESMDKIQNKKEERNKYRNMEKRCALLRTKIKNKVNDLHWKTIHYLTNNYDIIIIPIFETQKIISKSDNKESNRILQTYSHYRFRERLKHKCELLNKQMIICEEILTSQTCSNCGQNKKIKDEEIYKCKKCKIVIDRDINAAKNIYMKTLLRA